MDRQQALALLREILAVTNQIDFDAISLNQDEPGNFSLKISTVHVHDENVRNSINSILAREKLAMKQEKDTLIIYSAAL